MNIRGAQSRAFASRSTLLNLFAVLFFGLMGTSGAAGQAVGANAPAVTTYTARPASDTALDSRRLSQLGAGDQVTFQVYGQPDMDATMYVGDDGAIRVPLAGPVHIAGLSPVEAAQRVEQALVAGQYLVNPHVTITVVQSVGQHVSVLGEVKSPGRYPIAPNTSIFDLLAQAGGVTENAADVIYVQRVGTDGMVLKLRVERASAAMQIVQSGDSIEVPVAAQYYIYGEVASPGKYRIEPGMSVIQCIARAGGITDRGSERRVDIKRMDAGSGKSTVRHATGDDLVQANDVIHVKESIF